MRNLSGAIARSLTRARWWVLSFALVYAISVATGAVMVHSGNSMALATRDRIVGQARQSNPASLSLQRGQRLEAALWDFSANLFLGAVPNTVAGLAVVPAYPIAAHRGWIGGIVSVDGEHRSRLADPREAFYYLLTLILQLIPYSLAGGAGVNLGIAYFRTVARYQGKAWLLAPPREGVLDVLRIYLVIVPLFLIASLWEFLAR